MSAFRVPAIVAIFGDTFAVIVGLSIHVVLGPVEIHREFITAAARWIFAAKL
jgi:hypothetical protein